MQEIIVKKIGICNDFFCKYIEDICLEGMYDII